MLYDVYLMNSVHDMERVHGILLGKVITENNHVALDLHKRKDVVDVKFTHSIDHVGQMVLMLTDAVFNGYAIVCCEGEIFACGIVKCITRSKKIYYVEVECKSDNYSILMNDMYQKFSFSHVFFKDESSKILKGKLIVDRRTGDMSLFDKKAKNDEILIIKSFFDIEHRKTGLPVKRIKCKLFASWKMICRGVHNIEYILKNCELDVDTLQSKLPKTGTKVGNYIISQMNDIKYLRTSYTMRYTADLLLKFKLSWMYDIRREEICTINAVTNIDDSEKAREENIDLYCDLDNVLKHCAPWCEGLWYRSDELVLYRDGIYRCSAGHLSDDGDILIGRDSAKWHFISKNEDYDDLLNQLSVLNDKKERVLHEVLDILERFFDDNNFVYRIKLKLPMCKENLNIHVGSFVDLSTLNTGTQYGVSYVSMIECSFGSKYMFVTILACVNNHGAIDVGNVKKKEYRCWKYQDVSSVRYKDIEEIYLRLNREPGICFDNDVCYVKDECDKLSSEIEINTVYL